MHKNKHVLSGYAGGKSMRYKPNKQLSPHGEGMGLPKAIPNKKSDVNRKLIAKLIGRQKRLKRKMKRNPKSWLVDSWKSVFARRKKDLAFAESGSV